MGRKGRRLRKRQRAAHTNKHHLIFQRCHFSSGYGLLLRQAFIYELDIDIHNELHRHILHDVPKPSEDELRHAWEVYQEHKWEIDRYDIIEACEWLMFCCADPAWRACMKRQHDYLKSAMGG